MPLIYKLEPFDKLKVNGINQRIPDARSHRNTRAKRPNSFSALLASPANIRRPKSPRPVRIRGQ
jgi:hypothetical protein